MCIRRCLSIGLAAMPIACGVGVSGLESVSLRPPAHGGSAEPPILDAASSDDGAESFGDHPMDATPPLHGGAGSGDADTASPNAAADRDDGAVAAAGSLGDAEVVDLVTIGCPDRAACPAGYVCCAQFQDGGVIPAFDDAGAIETSCLSSCTTGTTPLCTSNADCGDAGVCFRAPATSSRGFCTPIPSILPTFPTGAGGH
jgi:hypothetical protein